MVTYKYINVNDTKLCLVCLRIYMYMDVCDMSTCKKKIFSIHTCREKAPTIASIK